MKKSEKKAHLVTARFAESTLVKIEREANRQGRSRSDVVRRLVERSLGCKRQEC